MSRVVQSRWEAWECTHVLRAYDNSRWKKRRRRRERKKRRLTGIAVVALPSREAYALPARATAVMTEVVVPRPAQVLATLPVIMRHASHPVLVHHLRMGAPVLVLGPIWPDVQPLLRSQPGYQHFLCKIDKIPS